MILSNSLIKFHHLKKSIESDEDGNFTLVRWDSDEAIVVPPIVPETIILLSQGKTVKETADKLKLGIHELTGLLDNLCQSNFISEIDGKKIEDNAVKIKPLLKNFNRNFFQFFLKKPFLYSLFLFIISGLFIGLSTPKFLPSYKQFFWTSDLFLVYISLFLIQIFLVFMHEAGHFIATKAIGGEATMRISYRYLSLVAETESYHMAVAPRVFRYFVYFAGMAVDFFIISLSYWILFLSNNLHWNIPLLSALLPAIILIEIGALIWQYNAFLETDMYNFLSDFLKEENLRINTQKYLTLKIAKIRLLKPIKNIGSQILAKADMPPDDFRFLTKTGRRHFVFYALILVSGMVLMTANYLLFIIPREITFISKSTQMVTHSFLKNDLIGLIKNVILFVLVIYQYLLLIWLRIRKNKHVKD